VPRRRCVGCGRVAPKPELLRLAISRDADERRARRAVIDAACILPGRGAYLCRRGVAALAPDPACLQLATRRGAVARALRRNVELDLGDSPTAILNS
jgi:predicted RNA-binding protein YlxR (DUF448 family)